jgi:hypothetical protein
LTTAEYELRVEAVTDFQTQESANVAAGGINVLKNRCG